MWISKRTFSSMTCLSVDSASTSASFSVMSGRYSSCSACSGRTEPHTGTVTACHACQLLQVHTRQARSCKAGYRLKRSHAEWLSAA
jgi:hypothetical protein